MPNGTIAEDVNLNLCASSLKEGMNEDKALGEDHLISRRARLSTSSLQAKPNNSVNQEKDKIDIDKVISQRSINRYKLIIEYDGSNFVGWQRQQQSNSIQQVLEEAIFDAFGCAVNCCAAGRTDAGVHAYGQVVHFDIGKQLSTRAIFGAINFRVRSRKIAVLSVEEVDKNFSARFSAKQRTYLYRIINRKAPLAINLSYAWHIDVPLNSDAMCDAAQIFVGKHDLTSFRSSQCQAHNAIRTIDCFSVQRHGDEINLVVAAQSFLHNQVRIMVGTLKRVGAGQLSIAGLRAILAGCDRKLAGQTAPAHGLYFYSVQY